MGISKGPLLPSAPAAPDRGAEPTPGGARGDHHGTTDSTLSVYLDVRNGAGDFHDCSETLTLPVSVGGSFYLSSALENLRTIHLPLGVPGGQYHATLTVNSGDPFGSSIDLGETTLEIVALGGVTRLDPSPDL